MTSRLAMENLEDATFEFPNQFLFSHESDGLPEPCQCECPVRKATVKVSVRGLELMIWKTMLLYTYIKVENTFFLTLL